MLEVLCVGHAAFDVSMTVARHPTQNEKTSAVAMQLAGGGPAANAAVQIAKLGGRAGFCGYLGLDIFGNAHLAELHAAHVDTTHVIRGEATTPLSQILAKPNGSRSVVNYKSPDTPPLSATLLDRAALPPVLLLDGHEAKLSLHLCKRAKQQGTITILDAGSMRAESGALIRAVDYVVASEKFARQFCGDRQENWLDQLGKQCPHVVITLGEAGVIWRISGDDGAMPAFSVNTIDSTGAGDAFHGAFAWGMVRRLPWNEMLRIASACGALTCTQLGARCALPDLATVQQFLERACTKY